jgi:hypothetical protein
MPGNRARTGIKGYFGEDSNQYELAGGTRASQRKRPTSRTNSDASTAAK